jgi:hypothetical protein
VKVGISVRRDVLLTTNKPQDKPNECDKRQTSDEVWPVGADFMVVGVPLALIFASTEPVVSIDETAAAETVLEVSSSNCEVERSVDLEISTFISSFAQLKAVITQVPTVL